MFRNRIDELGLFERLQKEDRPKLILLYGRRRVGKTELLNEFAKRHKSLYMLARQESEHDQLKKMSEEIAEFFGDEVLSLNPFRNYDALFTYLAGKGVPVIFDEFPYLVDSNKALPSILQEHWDKRFSKQDSFIVLCGSSISMMESLAGYKSPLYGRRTEQVLLEPLRFKDACKFLEGLSPEQKVVNYALLGGTPAYLLEFDYKKSVWDNLKERVLSENKFLYQDTMFVIQQELKEPRTYYSIIKSIANGNSKIGNIANDTGLDKGKVTKYLSVLQNLQLVERSIPITEKNPEKSRKGLYSLRDNYFRFWFRFIFPNKEYVEQGKQEKLIKEKIEPELNAFVGRAFEDVVLEWAKGEYGDYIFGRWWDKNDEIDVVGVDRKGNDIFFGEVKWKDLTEGEALRILETLKEKSANVKWGKSPETHFALFARRVENKANLAERGYTVLDLEDIVER